ncbi:hypothetical protein C1Y40_03138 [Mycobacterium talmoniae]|uniref:2-oxoadipate dioxygenase/decarboxylase n=1 Tax=Mycobacterium talmoniae TaxID=1858794 RepID=A0A2S8BJ36_9MYCO|nr:hypothetical protein C1Y40_03138 [Mycobacterium talmoniae]
MKKLVSWQLRERFAAALSAMYGAEVPAYTTLVAVTTEVNRDYAARRPGAERLGSLDRVTAERHGAIRVGTPAELATVADLFAAFGMYPVGYYDLRDADPPVPVVSTAFRPIDADELARNPFRVFTSMLALRDPRFFDPDLRRRVQAFLARRQLFDPALIEAAEHDHPGPRWLVGDLAELDLPARGIAEPFDIAMSAGNVMTFLAPSTRVQVLSRVRAHLKSDGRAVIGFGAGRDYEFGEFLNDAVDAGFAPDLLLSSWDLRPFTDDSDFLVAVLRPA